MLISENSHIISNFRTYNYASKPLKTNKDSIWNGSWSVCWICSANKENTKEIKYAEQNAWNVHERAAGIRNAPGPLRTKTGLDSISA